MMASANVELVRSICEAWARGDFSSADWADPDVELVRADGPSPRSWKGLAGLVEGTRDWIGAWRDVRMEPDEYRELDAERVLVLAHYSGRGRTSGVELEQVHTQASHVFHVRDGKVTRLVHYLDRERALADLGLAPEVE
jgi:ketosteroid isomerase-like protein